METPIISQNVQVKIVPLRIAKILQGIALGLTLISLITIGIKWYTYTSYPIMFHFMSRVALKCSVNVEQSIPTFYSVCLLLIAAILCWVIGQVNLLDKRIQRKRWTLLAFIFIYLSLDEAISIHEEMNAIRSIISVPTNKFLQWAWVIPGALFVLCVFVWYIPFLMALPAHTARLIMIAGTVYVTGAVGLEMLNSALLNLGNGALKPYKIALAYHAEELLEMTGIVLFIYSLLSFISYKCSLVVQPILDSTNDNLLRSS